MLVRAVPQRKHGYQTNWPSIVLNPCPVALLQPDCKTTKLHIAVIRLAPSSGPLPRFPSRPATACGAGLVDAWYHDESLPLVLVAELLAIPSFLLRCPRRHRWDCKYKEHSRAQAPGDHPDTDPREHFKHVIRARYQVKSKTFWDASIRRPWAAQITKRQVGRQITQLANSVKCDPGVGHKGIRGSCGGSIG